MGVTKSRERGIAALRVLMGAVFAYAGAEKLIGIGLEAGKSWSAGGFLKFATAGSWPGAAEGAAINPFQSFWQGLAADPTVLGFINFLVPWGELGIGLALVFGLGTRFASLMGLSMMVLFYLAKWDFALGVINSDLVYAVAFAVIGYGAAGEVYGLDAYVKDLSIVRRAPQLKYVLG